MRMASSLSVRRRSPHGAVGVAEEDVKLKSRENSL